MKLKQIQWKKMGYICCLYLFFHLSAKEINLYSFRQKFLIQPILNQFSESTGIRLNVIFIKKGLVERIKLEGKNSPADIVLTTDIGQLISLEEAGVLTPVKNEVLNRIIPSAYRHSEGLWFGLTTRARIIFASKTRVEDQEITTYEDLILPKWKGRICTRSGYHPYNVALISSLIEHKGIDQTRKWLLGLKANLARRPQGNDRAQIKAIKEGVCDLALGNTYYYGKMYFNRKSPEQKEWANAVKLIFPNQQDRGSHINISGMALAKHSPNRQNAIRFMEYLVSEKAQYLYAAENFEFPIDQKVSFSDFWKRYTSKFKWDPLNLERIGKSRKKAAKLLDQVSFDH